MADKKLVRSNSGLRFVSLNENNKSPFVIDEPAWISDNQCKSCAACNTHFNFVNRKHHCRRCGHVFCGKCCASRRALPRMSFVDPVRQCQICITVSRSEADLFHVQLKTLVTGCDMEIRDNENTSYLPARCKLSPDHRYLRTESDVNIHPLKLTSIDSIQRIASASDLQGHPMISEVHLAFSHPSGTSGLLHMKLPENENRMAASLWMNAFLQAMQFLEENRP